MKRGYDIREPHPKAMTAVKLKSGEEYKLEDWWQNVSGESWMWAKGNPACLIYAFRVLEVNLPPDDEVVYGKIGAFGHLIHVSEIEE